MTSPYVPSFPSARSGGSIARHRGDAVDPLSFDALREMGIDWAQQASGQIWTDYNLHDPGVSLVEALCFALTEDIFAARQSVPTLLGLDAEASNAAWERFGLSHRTQQEPCRPLSEQDWQLCLRQQFPQARHLQMRAQLDKQGHFHGLWSLALQDRGDAAPEQAGLRQQVLKAFWSRRNLAEDLAHPPRTLQPRWIRLTQLRIAVTGERELPELFGELLQRCDDFLSNRIPDSPEQDLTPIAPDFCDGPLGRLPHASELAWLEARHPVLHPADLARQLADLPGLDSVEDLVLAEHASDPAVAAHAASPQRPNDGLQRWGMDWALRLRWPESPEELAGWQVLKDGAVMRLDPAVLLAQLQEWRRVMSLRRAGSGGSAVSRALVQPWPGFPAADQLPSLPAWRADALPATAALPPLYEQALQEGAGHGPGLRAQWTGYRALLEQGLLQVQVQREQLPRLYALDQTDSRSYWPGLPSDAMLPGVEALLQTPHRDLPESAWIDDDPLARRHRLLDYQLALHGEQLDHGALQGLPCYFAPRAWSQHLLRLKRSFAQRLPRLTKERHAGADYSQAVLEQPDNTPPLQERLTLQMGCMAGHSRLLGAALQALSNVSTPNELGRAIGEHPSGPASTVPIDDDTRSRCIPLLEAQSRARPLNGPPLEKRLAMLAPLLRRLGPPLAWLQAAIQPQRFVQVGERGAALLLDGSGLRAWRLAGEGTRVQARSLAQALHELACLIQLHSEGLHLVETLLLRPVAGVDDLRLTSPEDPESGAALPQLYLVCTGWTVRSADERFQDLLEAHLMREAPAHLRCTALWLDPQEMLDFEGLWQGWLGQRRRYSLTLLAGLVPDRLCEALDGAAQALRDWLQAKDRRQTAARKAANATAAQPARQGTP